MPSNDPNNTVVSEEIAASLPLPIDTKSTPPSELGDLSPNHVQEEPWAERIMKDGHVRGVAFDWFQDLTRRLIKVEDKIKENEDENRGVADENLIHKYQNIRMIPEVHDCDWEHFKNRYSPDEGTPAIETLLGGHDMNREMEEEQLNRLDETKRRDFVALQTRPAKRALPGKKTEIQRIARVRINSPAVLSLIARVSGQVDWAEEKPHTFLRPFKIFIHFHDQIEKEVEELKSSFPEAEMDSNLAQNTDASAEGEGDGSIKPMPSATNGLSTAKQAYLEIRCYVEFVKGRLLPIYRKFDEAAAGTHTQVCFPELWSLFRVGEFIFESEDGKAKQATPNTVRGRVTSSHQSDRRLWRIWHTVNEDFEWVVDSLDIAGGCLQRDREDEFKSKKFRVDAYRIDYTGSEYVAVEREFYIGPYDGEKDITRLSVYPIRFQKDHDKIVQHLTERGKKFHQLIDDQHRALEHEGWTLLLDPDGVRLSSPTPNIQAVSEYIASDVIVDFEEAYQRHPTWKPTTASYIEEPWSPLIKQDLFPIIQWSTKTRAHEISRVTEAVVEEDDIHELEWTKYAETDNFILDAELRAERNAGKAKDEETKQGLADGDYALLPKRLFVYSFRDRKFVNADIRSLQSPPDVPDPFNELKIPDADKTLIRCMVRDHFEKKDIQRRLQNEGTESLEQDFIPGKGKGLVMLLHGAPGVGKTATAEAVAYAHKKPLFPITCGDLGIDPQTVESVLSDIFRLANLWDCVLLLDEAEIFLSRREKMDNSLQRNALVSIFLRTLEYYPGILFLTTNRVGALDEALNSRVHLSLFFQDLGAFQTRALFQMNLRRCKMIADQRALVSKEPVLVIKEEEICKFASDEYENHTRKNTNTPWWNGRQIRNAFQIATSLAYERATGEAGGPQRYLGKVHFDQILRAIDDYENYKLGMHHKTEQERAHERAERMGRPARGFSGRQPPRRYEDQQEMPPRSPYRYSQQQYQQGPHPSALATPERSREVEFFNVRSETLPYSPNTPSRPRADTPFGTGYPASQAEGALGGLPSPESPDARGYGSAQYYRSQSEGL